jgi:hypothetical protein
MAESKYGALYTEEDVAMMVALATRADDPGDVDVAALRRIIEGEGYELRFPADEPLFLLRGQDKAAPGAIAAGPFIPQEYGGGGDYYSNAQVAGADDEHLAAITKAERTMREWQHEHPDRVKVPT